MIKNPGHDRLAKVKSQLIRLGNSRLVKLMLEWERMSDHRKIAIRQDWDRYYQDCKKTRACLNYLEMVEAFKARDMNRVRELKHEAQDIMLRIVRGEREIPLPDFNDPVEFDFNQDCLDYRSFLSEKNQIEARLKDESMASEML